MTPSALSAGRGRLMTILDKLNREIGPGTLRLAGNGLDPV
ncbi:DUF4113 domain-containing protein [Chitinimonas taiwanensis]